MYIYYNVYLCFLFQCLDASHPWLCYWILHSLELLDEPLADDQISEYVFLNPR